MTIERRAGFLNAGLKAEYSQKKLRARYKHIIALNMWAILISRYSMPKSVEANQLGDTPYASAMGIIARKANIRKYFFILFTSK